MALKPITFSFLPTLPLPPQECILVNCNTICVIMVGAQYGTKLKRVLGKIPRLRGGFLKADDRCLGQLWSRKIVKLLVKRRIWGGRQVILLDVMTRASETLNGCDVLEWFRQKSSNMPLKPTDNITWGIVDHPVVDMLRSKWNIS